jgi:hypothetical protein
MNILFVVSRQEDWPFEIPGISAISARAYLMEPAYGDTHHAKVFNLCHSYLYQSHGYYVSLLAAARNHAPLPDVEAINDLQSDDLARNVESTLGSLIECSFAQADDDLAELVLYFGRDPHGKSERRHLCAQLFSLLGAPVLHARRQHSRRPGARSRVFQAGRHRLPAG